MVVKAVFFDIDGTLVDSNGFHVLAWEDAFVNAGCQVGRADIRKQIGKGADMLIPALLPGSDPEMRQSIAEAHGRGFKARYLSQVRTFPGATDLIARLHSEGTKIVLASSAEGAEVDHYVQLLEVGPYLTATTSADDVERSKPARDIFASALKKVASISATDTVAVGDTPYDVIAAGKCDIRTIAVLSGGFGLAELQNAGAVAIYGSVRDLLNGLDTSPLASAGTTATSWPEQASSE